MRRWALRISFLLLFLWIARAHGNVVPVFLGYCLWAYLVWAAWPRLVHDARRLWSYGDPLRVSLSRLPRRNPNSGF
ncbi:hypothetical protein [Thermomonospora catenispora]|uniref:hypothetical protein n=1 Tax=Thermomonospora catenispora TaxID=2493090 RepID=UPI00111CACC2|nr:hypothetical protein [Thermomonospora catenispora]TNY34422.1 hypothetical protein EIO00_23890 [Thermomonospora catenispora]